MHVCRCSTGLGALSAKGKRANQTLWMSRMVTCLTYWLMVMYAPCRGAAGRPAGHLHGEAKGLSTGLEVRHDPVR